MSDFPNLIPKKSLDKIITNDNGHHQQQQKEDDLDTLVDDSYLHSKPTSVVYTPGSSHLSSSYHHHDTTTLVDGQEGSSSSSRGLTPRQKKTVDASVQQLHYNENRICLDRAINQTIELMYELSEENKQRPIFYPTEIEDDNSILLNSPKAHLALVRQNLSLKSLNKSKITEDDDSLEKDLPEFKILKLNLKIGSHHDNVMANLDKKSIASLLEKKLQQQVKYLLNLKDRVDDTSSKVFVTGDLNSGKSTFCNALLRRKVLPEDQQPCTSVFCEVVDASKENNSLEEVHAIPIGKDYNIREKKIVDASKENNSLEEVHAIPIGKDYNIRDESTYEIHPIKNLEDLVYECDSISDNFHIHNSVASKVLSILHNGVIDIKLIDAPGLNMDSYQTTQVFSRQEEIDLVVFVVSAENHFTLSAKEFIAAAAAEKRYVFIVVNRFDNIKDKEKCKNRILDQIKNLSPDTYKDAKEFVHFVSATDVLEDGEGGGGGGDDGPDDGGDDDGHPDHPDFDLLEASLRKFILEKRSISKLLPAKNYLVNILNDLETLSHINEKIYKNEKLEKLQELNTKVQPKYNEIVNKSGKICDSINSLIENTCSEIYDLTSKEITRVVNNLGEKPVVKYGGLQYLFEYARESQNAMMDIIFDTVSKCEETTKQITTEKVDEIIKYGQNTLGEEFLNDKVFKSDLMFTRKKDTIGRQIDDSIEILDFFDPIALRDQIPSQITLHTIYSSGKLLTTGALIHKCYQFSRYLTPNVLKKVAIPIVIGISGFTIYYLISDIPNALPRKQARKIKKKIVELEYSHQNAVRMSRECRQVLNYPNRQVMNNFQTTLDKRINEKNELEKSIKDAELSFGYFHNLLKKIQYQQGKLNEIDLESVHLVD
ncbi:FZO1 [[Candida] subhashii]|uniref:FZO1 n=1 Tax=[Candida] subhashii TaxID=561895 RepID=A0A8J5QVS5_9ASCO|nr:FZO1 [[Candida] subhashii]KAG7665970.1 FZO1 [[Candida] subhashii]